MVTVVVPTLAKRQRHALDCVGQRVGAAGDGHAVDGQLGVLRGDSLGEVLGTGRIVGKQALQRGVAADADAQAGGAAPCGALQHQAVRRGAAHIQDAGSDAEVCRIDRVADALERIVACVDGDGAGRNGSVLREAGAGVDAGAQRPAADRAELEGQRGGRPAADRALSSWPARRW